jgi:hypothetical protein
MSQRVPDLRGVSSPLRQAPFSLDQVNPSMRDPLMLKYSMIMEGYPQENAVQDRAGYA